MLSLLDLVLCDSVEQVSSTKGPTYFIQNNPMILLKPEMPCQQ